MESLLLGLQESGFAAAMRGSLFLYPLANVVHILAALCFFAVVAAMDVTVLRAASVGAARAFIGRVRPWAILAFVLQVVSGIWLLAPEATHIFHNPVFRVKLVLIVIALVNVAVLEVVIRRGDLAAPSGGARGAAIASLGLWLAVAAVGRLIAYF